MLVSLILAHPDPKSFNAALAQAARQALLALGHQINFHDLCAEGFDPLLPAGEIARQADLPSSIQTHCQELAVAQGLIVVHPNWWGMPPAILTGWLDRVLRPGVAYEFLEGDSGEGVPRGLLRVQTALILNTSNTEARREQEVFGDPLERIWRHCVCDLCGVGRFERRMFGVVVNSSAKQRAAWLEEVRHTVAALFPPDKAA
ncbi:MAG: NAD(P)H-dependent oxidoreductase [Desulfarculus sp.]|nr:NAD(P)H-dependent oxidoreductase [Desulfarculus sp.]